MENSGKQTETYQSPQITIIAIVLEGAVLTISNETLEESIGEW